MNSKYPKNRMHIKNKRVVSPFLGTYKLGSNVDVDLIYLSRIYGTCVVANYIFCKNTHAVVAL